MTMTVTQRRRQAFIEHALETLGEPNFTVLVEDEYREKNIEFVLKLRQQLERGQADFAYISEVNGHIDPYYDLVGMVVWGWEAIPVPVLAQIFNKGQEEVRDLFLAISTLRYTRGDWEDARRVEHGVRQISILLQEGWVNAEAGFNLASVLPVVGKPWFSIGDTDTLARIGEILDGCSERGSEQPDWEAAMKIAALHAAYCGVDGGYSRQYKREQTGFYSPGSCLVAPVGDHGMSGKWGISLTLTATVGRKIKVFVGPEGGRATRRVEVDFVTPSVSSAWNVREYLARLGLMNYQTE